MEGASILGDHRASDRGLGGFAPSMHAGSHFMCVLTLISDIPPLEISDLPPEVACACRWAGTPVRVLGPKLCSRGYLLK